jgi:hypothetical protein
MVVQEMDCEKMNQIQIDQNCDQWQAHCRVHMLTSCQKEFVAWLLGQSISKYFLNWKC